MGGAGAGRGGAKCKIKLLKELWNMQIKQVVQKNF